MILLPPKYGSGSSSLGGCACLGQNLLTINRLHFTAIIGGESLFDLFAPGFFSFGRFHHLIAHVLEFFCRDGSRKNNFTFSLSKGPLRKYGPALASFVSQP